MPNTDAITSPGPFNLRSGYVLRARITDTEGDKAADVFENGEVIFGRVERDGSFVCAHSKPSKGYKTPKGAARAAARWVAN